MAQTLPPSSDPAHSRPRYASGRAAVPRAPRPRFGALDALWIALLLGTFIGAWCHAHGGSASLTPAVALPALTVGAAYGLAWRAAGRAGGIAAGLLLATSAAFVRASGFALGDAFSLLVTLALMASVMEMPLLACALAAGAAVARPDGILLGLMLLALASVRAPRQALPAAGLFVALTVAGWAVRIALLHQAFPVPVFHAQTGHWAWALTPASAFLLWFLLPFAGELTDPARGARWSPVVLWLLVYGAAASFVQFAGVNSTALALMPALFVALAGGVARLLPALAGDKPALRYVLAALAVGSLVLLRAQGEWAAPSHAAPAASAPKPVPVPAAPLPPPAVPSHSTPGT